MRADQLTHGVPKGASAMAVDDGQTRCAGHRGLVQGAVEQLDDLIDASPADVKRGRDAPREARSGSDCRPCRRGPSPGR